MKVHDRLILHALPIAHTHLTSYNCRNFHSGLIFHDILFFPAILLFLATACQPRAEDAIHLCSPLLEFIVAK